LRKSDLTKDVLPVIETPKYYLVNIAVNSLFFLAVCPRDTDALMVIEFLARIADVFRSYFGKDSAITEETLKDNIFTIYQLLDEIGDGGAPFTTEPNILKEMITPPSFLGKVTDKLTGGGQSVTTVLPDGLLTNVYWRRANAKYANNEIYLDIIEHIHTTIDRNGLTLSSEVAGEVQCNSKLSGMPDLSLKFANASILDDVSLHPCVRFSRYDREKIVSFIPPDGEFKLMDFRIVGNIQLPLYVKPQFYPTETGAHVQIVVGTKSNMLGDRTVDDIVITIPFSKNTASFGLSSTTGTVHFDDVTKIATWTIGKLRANTTATVVLEGNVTHAIGTPRAEFNPIINLGFSVTSWSASGLKVDSLLLFNEKYTPQKYVRSITKGGNVQIRG
jgi:AP-3 complex subunit mu